MVADMDWASAADAAPDLEDVDVAAGGFAGWTMIGAGDWDFAIPATAIAMNKVRAKFRVMVLSVLAAVYAFRPRDS